MNRPAFAQSRRPFRTRGVALLLILSCVLFTSLAVLASSAFFAAQVRRGRDLPIAAQHRHLLLAASQSLLAHLNANNRADFTLPLPAEIPNTTVRITADPAVSADSPRYRITVTTGKVSTHQVLTFEKKSNLWVITDASLSAAIN